MIDRAAIERRKSITAGCVAGTVIMFIVGMFIFSFALAKFLDS
jgi:hypothetical protein